MRDAPELGTEARQSLPRAILLAVGLFLLSYDVATPFSGLYEWNSAQYAYFARNHLEYGLSYTQLYCTHGHAAAPAAVPDYYINHPPLICAFAALPMAILGDHEWVARSVAIAATLGAASLLMGMIARLQSPTLALVTGFFYLTLPITAYFGRMLDHVPLAQFFSLLMLHGYLEWMGLYPDGRSRRAGALYFAVGTVAGIGTAWAVLAMAGQIWVWHLIRTIRKASGWRAMMWVTLAPGITLLAVMIHIAAATGWDLGFFQDLFSTRSVGQADQGPKPWPEWFGRQWDFLRGNFSTFAVVAVLAFAPIAALVLRRTEVGSPYRQCVRSMNSLIPSGLIALQGLIYVITFKNHSWTHSYWQYLIAPFVAICLATAVLTLRTLCLQIAPRAAASVVTVALLLAPMPSFTASWSRYHAAEHIPVEYLEVYDRLDELIPHKASVMTSRNWAPYEETFGGYTQRWTQPQIAYHANRPLIHTRDLTRIAENPDGSAAYVLEFTNDPDVKALRALLTERYKTFRVGRFHLVALLGQRLEGRAIEKRGPVPRPDGGEAT